MNGQEEVSTLVDPEVSASELMEELRDIGQNFERFETGSDGSVDFDYGDDPKSQVKVSLVKYSEGKGFFNFTIDNPDRVSGTMYVWFDFETGDVRSAQVDRNPVPPRKIVQISLNLVREFKARK